MSEPVALLTSKKLSSEELFTFTSTVRIPQTEVVLRPRTYCDAQLIRDDENVWITFNSEDIHYDDDDEDTKIVLQKLGAFPQSNLVLDISRNPQSQHLAVAFALAFTKQWPCVVDNLRGDEHEVFSAQEVLELYKENKGFWDQ